MAEPMMAPPGAAPGSAQLSIERIYVKDLSLENPAAPQSFQIAEPPQVESACARAPKRSSRISTNVY